jgi:hypothetical protein
LFTTLSLTGGQGREATETPEGERGEKKPGEERRTWEGKESKRSLKGDQPRCREGREGERGGERGREGERGGESGRVGEWERRPLVDYQLPSPSD